jgi:hypothetical protein
VKGRFPSGSKNIGKRTGSVVYDSRAELEEETLSEHMRRLEIEIAKRDKKINKVKKQIADDTMKRVFDYTKL